MKVFDVYLRGVLVDTVFYSRENKITADEVRRSLIEHDAYNPEIVVKQRREKK